MMTQRPFNMHVGIYTKTLCDDLRKCLLITLTLLFVCPGVWGQSDVIEVSTKEDFRNHSNWRYYLENGKTYKLIADIDTGKEGLYIYGERNVTIDLNGHTLNGGYQYYSSPYYGYPLIKNDGTLTIKGTGTIAYGYGDPSGGIANNGELTLENVTVTGNKSGNLNGGGGIYNNGTLYIKGNTTVTGNTFQGTSVSNIYLPESKVIHIADNITGAANGIGITMATRGTFTSGLNGHGASNQFSSDVAGLEIATTEGGEAKIITVWEVLQQQLNTKGESSGTVTLDQDYTAISGDIPLEISGTVTLDLNGHTIDRGLGSSSATANGEVINITSGGNLTITGTGTITGGNVSGNGGAIINAGTLDIQGGTITGNSATGNGGAVFNTGTATISGGTLSSNSAAQGGAIYNSGTLTISAGNISSNTATTNGGGIYHYNGTLNISGAPSISGNQKSSTANNIYLASGKQITINGDLSNTTPIGVTLADGVGVFTSGLNSHTGDYNKFESDDNRFQTADATGEAKLWTFWEKLNTLLANGGTVNLDRDYSAVAGFDNSCLSINTDVTLNLNSHTIDRGLASPIENGCVIKVESGKTLTITGTGQITGGNNSGNGGGIHIADGGTLVLSGGNITGNTAALGGGVYNGGTLQMSGAPIVTGNTGGNVYLPDDHSTITLVGTMNGSDGNIGITMQTPGAFTSGLNTYGTIAKFFSDNSAYTVILSGDEATLMTHWNALKAAFAAGGDVNLTRSYTAPDGEKLEVKDSKTVTLDLRGYTIDRGLSDVSAVDNGYVIKVNTGSTLTIKDTGGNGKIKGGNNTGNGGGILNEGTLNIQGGTITSNSAAQGGAIYNSGTLTVSGGTIQDNTATTNGGAIYHTGTSFSLQGSPTITNNRVSSTDNNVYLAATKIITISGILNNTNAIGIVCADDHLVFTTGLSGNGNASKFTSNQTGKGIGLNSAGEAIFGTSYTITREEPNNSYTYMYIKGNYIDNEIAAVEGEYVRVTISGDGNYHTVPVSLSYTEGVLSSYPMGGVEYGFIMPAKPVTVTGLCLYGGYCGNANDEDIKYYLDDTTLRFQAKDASNYQMKNYAQNTVPWRDTSTYPYTSVDIPNNITHISDYAFYGSGLTTAVIPASIATIGTFAFGNCTSLTAINVNAGNANFMNNSSDGVLYTRSAENPTNLVCYPAGKSGVNYSVPSTVTAITDGAFAYGTHLQSIAVAGGNAGFTAPDGVLYKKSGENATAELVYYPADKAGTTYLIPKTTTIIDPYAFHYGNHLQRVYLHHTSVPTGGEHMFDNTTCKIMVKDGLTGSYQGTANWSSYGSRIKAIRLSDATITLNYPELHWYGGYYVDFDDAHPTEEKRPDVTGVVSNAGDGYTLAEGVDYTVSYTNNVNIGLATVNINGIGNYEGVSGTQTFNITRNLTFTGTTSRYVTYHNTDNVNYAKPVTNDLGLTAYLVTEVNFTNGTVTLSSGMDWIPANMPVILFHQGGCNREHHLKVCDQGSESTTYDDTHFKGVGTTAKDLSTLKNENGGVEAEIYALRNEEFYRAYTGTLAANRCYIVNPGGGGGALIRSFLSFINGEDDTTSIEVPIEEIFGEDFGDWYTLDGRKLQSHPTQKGIYIHNGKKIAIK